MARVTDDQYPMPDYDSFEDYDAYHQAQKDALNDISEPIIRFPRADGYALYRVVEMEHIESCDCCGRGGEPLLQHIPYGDGYRASSATINGLTTAAARSRVE